MTGEAVPEFSEHAKSVTFTVGIPEDELPKKRIKLFYHIFKHDDVAYDELQKIVRMRTYKWVRRVYAQANLSPKIVGMEELEQPARNLLSICGILKGGEKIMPPTAAGGSSVKLKLGTDTIEVALTDTMTMGDVKDAIVSELEGTHGLTTEVKEINFSALYADEEKTVPVPPTFDIYIYEDSAMATPKEFAKNRPVDCTDRNYRDAFEVPKFELDDDDMLVGGSPSHRMALCQGASSDDQIDVYLVPKAALCGRAYPLYKDTNFSDDEQKKLLPLPELRRAAWVAYYTSDTDKRGVVFGKDWWVSPFTLAHEIDHVLADTGHNGAEGDLMMGTKWSKFNSVEAEKRIYADPILVGSPRMNLELGEGESPYITEQDMRRDLHDRRAGTGIAGVTGDVLEPW